MNQLSNRLRLTLGTPAIYCITILGQLSQTWSQEFGHLTIETIVETEHWSQTKLTGTFQDHAALFGILNYLYGLGFPLVSVECLAVIGQGMSTSSSC
jgi:sorbitol-specific phosphotransferase system component IIA